jgi:integrase
MLKTKPFLPEELKKIRKYLKNRIDGRRDLAMFNTQVDTMLRTSDLRNLRVSDVQEEASQEIKDDFTVKMKKTSKTVSVCLGDEAKESLKDWIDESGKSFHDYLFTGRKDPNKPITDTHHRHLVKKWCSAAGVKAEAKATHSLRKAKATAIYKETKNVEAVRMLLGHSSVTATSAYLGIEDADALDLARKMKI